MRWLVRLLVFWAISGPLFYVFGLPYLLDLLAKKAQTQGYSQCKTQLSEQKLVGTPDAPLSAARGEKYCHCVSDGLILTQNDVFDLVQHKPPAGLNARAKAQADKCNTELQNELANPAPPPASNKPDSKGLIHL